MTRNVDWAMAVLTYGTSDEIRPPVLVTTPRAPLRRKTCQKVAELRDLLPPSGGASLTKDAAVIPLRLSSTDDIFMKDRRDGHLKSVSVSSGVKDIKLKLESQFNRRKGRVTVQISSLSSSHSNYGNPIKPRLCLKRYPVPPGHPLPNLPISFRSRRSRLV